MAWQALDLLTGDGHAISVWAIGQPKVLNIFVEMTAHRHSTLSAKIANTLYYIFVLLDR